MHSVLKTRPIIKSECYWFTVHSLVESMVESWLNQLRHKYIINILLKIVDSLKKY